MASGLRFAHPGGFRALNRLASAGMADLWASIGNQVSIAWITETDRQHLVDKTVGQKRERLRYILDRDDYRCGIHLGGCGKPLSIENATIDHIEPKATCIAPYDEIGTKEMRNSIRRKQQDRKNPIFPKFMNIQPMHRSCNEKKGSVYPPVPIITHCSCCEYMYIAKRNRNSMGYEELKKLTSLGHRIDIQPTINISATVDGVPAGIELPTNPRKGDRFFLLAPVMKNDNNPNWILYMREWRPVLPRDDDDTWQWRAEKVALLRRIKYDDAICYIAQTFTHHVQMNYGDEMVSPHLFTMFGNRKDGRRQAGWDKDDSIGNLVSIDHMLQHNLSGYNDPRIICDIGNLSDEESRIISSLPWGHDWISANWLKSEFDNFGIVAVSPNGRFSQRNPQTSDKVFISWNFNPKHGIIMLKSN